MYAKINVPIEIILLKISLYNFKKENNYFLEITKYIFLFIFVKTFLFTLQTNDLRMI